VLAFTTNSDKRIPCLSYFWFCQNTSLSS